MSKAYIGARNSAAKKQNHHCFYCNAPMWQADVVAFAADHQISIKKAKFLQCTAEHLLPQANGGLHTRDNIVAACLYCNQKRHARSKVPTPLDYKKFVQQRVLHGRWFLGTLPDTMRAHNRSLFAP
jgi:5-methylcytosine-specific restriction endonuclease McrA